VSARTVKLLHVEDSQLPRRIVAQRLASLDEYHFDITCVATEQEAIKEFGRRQTECVILDYHLSEGDGLSCLRKLRELDPIVPIIAVSGKATPEIAAELLEVGADDYISKSDLQEDSLAHSVRAALTRADAWRQYHAAGGNDRAGPAQVRFQRICKDFAASVGSEFLKRLAKFEAAAREEKLTAGQLQRWFELAAAELASTDPASYSSTRRLLRPLLLEMLLRLYGERPEHREGPRTSASWRE
jgi:DNA-binding response OmpR family regulator